MKRSLLPEKTPADARHQSPWTVEELEQILRDQFGHSSFRGKQLEAIQNVLSGRDCFCLMPTGGGKSICYQVPALAKPGICLVLSPLIALMENQVAVLKEKGIPAEFLSSSQTTSVKEKIHDDLDSGKPSVRLLYVTPELVATPGFMSKLTKIHSKGLLNLIAIDEAHCISSWGHDFRPSYRKLSSLRVKFPDVPILALTATAAPQVRNDVIDSLALRNPTILLASFNRPNIFYEVRYKDLLDDTYLDLSKLIKSSGRACSIIYCLERSTCDDLSAYLVKNGISCAAYHAGLNNKMRSAVLDDWISSKVQVVVATVAFGMGIDRKDVRLVCHFNIPKSMESFYQESGRAGRDQLPSRSLLYYGADDRRKMEFILSNERNKKKQTSITSEKSLRNSVLNFSQMVKYCEETGCRRKKILESFGEQVSPTFCQKTCDACKYPNKVAGYVEQYGNLQGLRHKSASGISPVFISSGSLASKQEDQPSEFWNYADDGDSQDEEISDSDDGDVVVNTLCRSRLSAKLALEDKINLLQKAEEMQQRKEISRKQIGLIDNKAISDSLRKAIKQRLLDALKQAQERLGGFPFELESSADFLEMECYNKYGKVGKTFYNSQIASTVRWLNSSTSDGIMQRLESAGALSNCQPNQNLAPVPSPPLNPLIPPSQVIPELDSEGCNGMSSASTLADPVPASSSKATLPPIPSFSEFLNRQANRLSSSGASSARPSHIKKENREVMPGQTAEKRARMH